MLRVAVLGHAYVDPAHRGKLRALVGLGATVTVAVPNRWPLRAGAPATATAWEDDHGVDVVPIRVRGRPDASLRWSRRDLRRLLAEFRPDLLQIEEEPETRAAADALAVARRLRIPAVLFTGAGLPVRLPWRLRRRRARILRQVAGVMAGNPMAADLVARARPGLPVAVVPQFGVAPPPTVALRAAGGLTLGFVGRLVPEQGLDLLLRALVRVHAEWTLHVVGSGPDQEEFERLAERLGLAARITWHGALGRAALEPVWDALEALVLPSRTTRRWIEPFGRRAVEAMARGIPVVVTDSGALPDTVGAAGLVVPEDDVEALAEAIQRLHDDPGHRHALAAVGRERVLQEFSDAAVARRALEFWRAATPATRTGSDAATP